MTAPVMDRVPGRSQPSWRTDRRPVIVAVAVVAAVVACCWLLRWWGPINPAVSGSVAPADRVADHVTIVIDNASLAPVEVVAVTPSSSAPSWSAGSASSSGSAAGFQVGSLPVVAGRSTGEIRLDVPVCRPGSGWSSSGLQWWVVQVRSASGRVVPVEVRAEDVQDCRATVPIPGVQPADSGARDHVVAAFAGLYRGPADASNLAFVDDPHGVADATNAARAGQFGAILDSLRISVDEVVFDRPDHAWVRYGFPGTVVTEHWGEAVLVDGTWKVARDTICRDLTMVAGTCGP